MSHNQDKVIDIIREVIDAPSEIDSNYKIGSNSGWDSLSIVRLIVMLENELDIILKLDFFTEERTVSDICQIKNEE